MTGRVLAAAVVLLGLMPGLMAAQSCWLAKPSCRSFWLTESGPRVGNDEAFVNERVGSVTTVGYMINRSARWAMGGALELSTGSDAGLYRLAVVPRYRRWLGPQVALDLGAGVAFLGEGNSAAGFKGVTGLVGLVLGPLVALTAQVETREFGNDVASQTAGSVGVRFGGWAGPAAALASLALGVLASAGGN